MRVWHPWTNSWYGDLPKLSEGRLSEDCSSLGHGATARQLRALLLRPIGRYANIYCLKRLFLRDSGILAKRSWAFLFCTFRDAKVRLVEPSAII